MKGDMHIHTTASDGQLTPEEVVSIAKNTGLDFLAVTDHDTVYNLPNVKFHCKSAGIIPLNGIEVSAYEGNLKVHTLGYGFDCENAGFKKFTQTLLQNSLERTEHILKKLNMCGVNINMSDISAVRISAETPIHAIHICRAAVNKGYDTDPFCFFRKYLIPGAPAFSNICRPSPEEAISEINSAGGFAVIAHPGRIELEREELRGYIFRLVSAGLKGIEAVYSTHTVIETAYFKELAEELCLYITGGSDTHFNGSNRKIGEPVFCPSAALRQRLKI